MQSVKEIPYSNKRLWTNPSNVSTSKTQYINHTYSLFNLSSISKAFTCISLYVFISFICIQTWVIAKEVLERAITSKRFSFLFTFLYTIHYTSLILILFAIQMRVKRRTCLFQKCLCFLLQYICQQNCLYFSFLFTM